MSGVSSVSSIRRVILTFCTFCIIAMALPLAACNLGGSAVGSVNAPPTATPTGPHIAHVFPFSGGYIEHEVLGGNGNIWFVLDGATSQVEEMTPTGQIVTPQQPKGLYGQLATGPNGSVWAYYSDEAKASDSADETIGFVVFTSDGQNKLFPLDTKNGGFDIEAGLILGPDGNMWFSGVGAGASMLGRITPSGSVTFVRAFTPSNTTQDIGQNVGSQMTVGPNNTIWFASDATPGYGYYALSGGSAIFDPPNNTVVEGMVASSTGAIWTNEVSALDITISSIQRVTSSGALTPFTTSNEPKHIQILQLLPGGQGDIWFVYELDGPQGAAHGVGFFTPDGVFTTYPLINFNSLDMAVFGADKNLWVADNLDQLMVVYDPQ